MTVASPGHEAHRVRPLGVGVPERRAVVGGGVGVAALQLTGVEDVVGDHQACVAEIIACHRQVDDLVHRQERDALVEPHATFTPITPITPIPPPPGDPA